MEWGPERPHDGSAECPAAARDVPCAACDYEFGWFGLSDENKGQEWHWHRVTAYRLPADVLMPAIANDAHALDESKLLDLIRDLDTGHIQDIDRTATSNAISSLWDMVVKLRVDLARAEEASQSHYLQAMENGGHLNALRAQVAEAEKRGRIAGLEKAVCVADDHTPEKHSGMTLASHVTGRTIAAAIRDLIAQAKGDDA